MLPCSACQTVVTAKSLVHPCKATMQRLPHSDHSQIMRRCIQCCYARLARSAALCWGQHHSPTSFPYISLATSCSCACCPATMLPPCGISTDECAAENVFALTVMGKGLLAMGSPCELATASLYSPAVVPSSLLSASAVSKGKACSMQ